MPIRKNKEGKIELNMKKYPDLLIEQGLPDNTPPDLVVELLEDIEAENIDVNDNDALEKIFFNSALWQWAKDQERLIEEPIELERLAQRLASLFGV